MDAIAIGLQANVQDIEEAAAEWLQRGDFAALVARLNALPQEMIASRPVLLRLHAHTLKWTGEIALSQIALERARLLATQGSDWEVAVRCALDLARWHQQWEQIEPARVYLDAARNHAGQLSHTDLALEGELALAIGRLSPDLGLNDVALEYCTQALRCFERLGNVAGQVEALWILAVVNTYLARLLEAQAQIEHALRLHHVGGLDALLYLYLVNVRAQIALYGGDTEDGLQVIRQQAEPLLRQHLFSKPGLYLEVTRAALLRQRGDFAAALAACERGEEIIAATQNTGFRPWLSLEREWTRLLAGEIPASVRRALLEAVNLQDMQVKRWTAACLGVFDLLEERWDDAEQRLRSALQAFQAWGMPFAVFCIRTYLAYIYLKRQQSRACHREIAAAFGWAEEVACDGFPELWHPRIVAVVCLEALRAAIHPRQAEVMIVRRLGDAAVSGLLTLADAPEPDVRQRARSVLAALDRDKYLLKNPGGGAILSSKTRPRVVARHAAGSGLPSWAGCRLWTRDRGCSDRS